MASDPWAAFAPTEAQEAPKSAEATNVGAAPQSQPAASSGDPWAAFQPQQDYSPLKDPPGLLQSRLGVGTAFAKGGVMDKWGDSLTNIWQATKDGAQAGFDAQGLQDVITRNRQDMQKLGIDPEGPIGTTLHDVLDGSSAFLHAINGALAGGAEAVNAALGGQPGGGGDFYTMAQSVLLHDPTFSPLIPAREGRVARLFPDDNGQMQAQVVGGMPMPKDFQEASQLIASKAKDLGKAPMIEGKLMSLWQNSSLHPNEVVDAVNRSPSTLADLSAAKAPPIPPPPLRPTTEWINSIDDNLNRLRGAAQAKRLELTEQIKAMPPSMRTPEVDARMFQHMEGDPEANLNDEELANFNKYLVPWKKEELARYEEIAQTDLPVKDYDPEYAHRIVVGKEPVLDRMTGEGGQSPLPTTARRGLPTSTSAAKPRAYFSLENASGDRQLVRLTDKNELLAVGPNGTSMDIPHGLDKPVMKGDQFDYNNQTWTVKGAYTREIEALTPTRYYKSGVVATAQNLLRLDSAARAMFEVQRLKDTPEFQAYTQPVFEGMRPPSPDWYTPNMPLFRGYIMHPKLANVIDDFYGKAENGGDLEKVLQNINRFTINSLFLSPIPHAGNAASHWFVARGWDWLNPVAYKSLAVTGGKAIKAVYGGTEDYRTALREGSGLVYSSVVNQNFYQRLLQSVGQDIVKNPSRWQEIGNAVGFTKLDDLVQSIYQGSSKALWSASDVFMMQRLYELQDRGMTLREAIAHAEEHIPNYRIPPEVLGSRSIQQVLTNDLLTAFSRYHYGMLKSHANMIGNLALGNGQQRFEAVGQLLATAFLSVFVWPMISAGLERLTGEPNLKITPFGATRIPTAIIAAAHDNHWIPHGWESKQFSSYYNDRPGVAYTLSTLVTPAPATEALVEAFVNKNLVTGKSLVEPADVRHYRIGRVAAQAGDFAAKSVIEPYESIADSYHNQEPYWEALLESSLGVSNKSGKQINAAHEAQAHQESEARSRQAHPEGLIEDLERLIEKHLSPTK